MNAHLTIAPAIDGDQHGPGCLVQCEELDPRWFIPEALADFILDLFFHRRDTVTRVSMTGGQHGH